MQFKNDTLINPILAGIFIILALLGLTIFLFSPTGCSNQSDPAEQARIDKGIYLMENSHPLDLLETDGSLYAGNAFAPPKYFLFIQNDEDNPFVTLIGISKNVARIRWNLWGENLFPKQQLYPHITARFKAFSPSWCEKMKEFGVEVPPNICN